MPTDASGNINTSKNAMHKDYEPELDTSRELRE